MTHFSIDRDGLAETLCTPLAIAGKSLRTRLVLAPMAGLGHIAFRDVVDAFGGCGLMFTGMCSAKAVPTENPKVSSVFSWREAELDRLVCQLVGADPDVMAAAARRIEKEGFWGVDLNLGCSVSTICKQGAGAALLRDPERAVAVVEAVRDAVQIPVLVKYRTGWTDDPGFACDMGARFEAAGADALTFHPRVSPDRRTRPPKWDYIRQVKASVKIPVFGNGNVFSPEDARRMLSETGCDGISVGRMAVAAPWLFARWTGKRIGEGDHFRETGEKIIASLKKYYDPHLGFTLFKKYAIYFCANFAFGHSLLKQLLRCKSLDAAADCLNEFLGRQPAIVRVPDMNLFIQ
ncbi:MAG: tRNA-dihydrouridine synthase [Deltaproteobacteria bacterium]|nr:MAG: tRNA-dihydrouridine synthase [Deltaproteobacteria bacterium]